MDGEKKVVMYGLYAAQQVPDLPEIEQYYKDWDIWTLNDFYRGFNDFKPHRIFQVHHSLDKCAKRKWSSDWKERYNASGAEVITAEIINGVNVEQQTIFPFQEAFSEFPPEFFCSSFNYMMAMAYLEGYTHINIERVALTSSEEEYTGQARGILYAIREMEKRGVSVDWPYRVMWEKYLKDYNIAEDDILIKREKVYGCPSYTPKTVNFLGMYWPEVGTMEEQRIMDCDELWTLNDWYTFYDVKPHAVFNPCDETFTGHQDSRRFVDWVKRYNESGAKIVTLGKVYGINNQHLFSWARGVKEFGEDFFTSTLSYMFAQAIWEGYEVINIYGVRMEAESEYAYQLPGIMRAINECTQRGIQVNCRFIPEWIDKMTSKTVDWANMKGGKVPYFHSDNSQAKIELMVDGL